MNTPALTRLNPRGLPQWTPGSPGYMSLHTNADDPARQASRLATTFRKYWWVLVVLWAIVAIPATVLIYKTIAPQYVAAASINVAPVVMDPVKGTEYATAFYNEYLRTQAELMKNPYVLQRAAEDIRLSKYQWFHQLSDQVGYLTDNVSVDPIPATQNIRIAMTHRDAEAATAIVDSVVDAYLDTRNRLEEQNSEKSLDIVKKLQANTDKLLKDSQEQLAKLTTDGDMSWSEADRKVISDVLGSAKTTQGKLEADQLTLQAQLANLKAKQLPDKETYLASVQTDNDPQLDTWIKRRIEVQMLDSALETTQHALPEHPERVALRKQLKTLDANITARRAQIRDTAWSFYKAGFELERSKKLVDAEADLAGVTQQIAALEKRITAQENLARDLGSKTQPIAALKEQIADAKVDLKRYNDRIEQIENLNRAPGRVASVAPTITPRTPTVDKRPKLALAANGLGFLLGAGVLVLLVKLRDKIDQPEDLHHDFQPLVVGTVSHAGASARGLPGRMRRKILGEEMRLLHANLLPPGPMQRRLLMITSPTPGNGKTSIASQLALSLAKSGLEVLLIDADLRKRDLSTMFDVGFRPGLADLLQGKPPELIRPVELLPNLRLMGAGTKLERNPVELFQRKAFHESLNLLHEKFDCIVVDTPPTLVVADARLIARSCDEVLCVVRAQVTSPKEVNETLDALSRITGKSPKIILNAVEQRQSYYKYKFAYSNAENDAENEAAHNAASGEPTL